MPLKYDDILHPYFLAKMTDFLQVLYIRDVYQPPEELPLEGCDVLCPLNTFIKLTEHHIPKNYTAECDSNINLD